MPRRLAIFAIIAVLLAAPIAEMFDRWDDTQYPADDSELNLVVVALCVGVAFAVGPIIIANRIRAVSSTVVRGWRTSEVEVLALAPSQVPVPTISPHPVLRV